MISDEEKALSAEDRAKQKVQRGILIVSCILMAGKFTAYVLTSSVGILTDALESIVNVTAGAVSLYSLYAASKPKDKDHPFGHGKIELLSASLEGFLIIMAGLLIVYESVMRFFSPTELTQLDVGIYIVAAAGAVNFLLGRYSVSKGKKYGSMALVAGGLHLQSDTWSSIGLVAGLLLLFFTGVEWIDSALGIVFGTIILLSGISILRKTLANLLDRADMKILADLADTLNSARQPDWVDIHNAKVLKYGNYLHLDCDLTVPWFYTVEQGHACGEKLQDILEEKYADRIQFTIHIDPCNVLGTPQCAVCGYKCPERKERFCGNIRIDLNTFTKEEPR